MDSFLQRTPDPIERLRQLRKAASLAQGKKRSARPRRYRLLSVLLGTPALLLLLAAARFEAAPSASVRPIRVDAPGAEAAVWQVESSPEYETYSNGLRIENRYATDAAPRRYAVLPVQHPERGSAQIRNNPAGIVFHTTESAQAPFEADENQRLRLIGQALLEYVRAKRAYNFVIDRFGRVYRIVPEGETANHAGHSIWADDRWLYINLNESFIGISFEARTDPESGDPANAAQLNAAAALTEMLRNRYAIPAGNCVTHGQVSVNPANMRVGYHTDWGSAFPFERLRLPDNYSTPLPAVWAAGFTWDPVLLRSAGSRFYVGLALGEERVREAAAAAACPVETYRARLQQFFKIQQAALLASAHSRSES